MKKTNKLISCILSVIMLVSMFPQAIFADEMVAKIGEEYYDNVYDAFSAAEDGNVIELLKNVSTDGAEIYVPCKVEMNGFSITVEDGAELGVYATEGSVEFVDGTINGKLDIDAADVDVTVTAPIDAEYAINGKVYVKNGRLTVSGAKVGIMGEISDSGQYLDISGTEKAVDISSEIPTIANYKITGSADINGTMSDAVFEENTYKVNGVVAKHIRIEETSTPPIAEPVPSITEDSLEVYTGQSVQFHVEYSGDEKLTAYVQKGATDNSIEVTVSADQKIITVTTKKNAKAGDYPLFVHVVGKANLSDSATLVVKVCDHDLDSAYKCKNCGVQMTVKVIYDKDLNKTEKYFETIDEAIEYIPDFDEKDPYEQYTLQLLKDVELDHDLIIKDKAFEFTTHDEKYELSFTDGKSMKISRDIISDGNFITIFAAYKIGSITLGKDADITNNTPVIIGTMNLEDENAKLNNIFEFKINNLYVKVPNLTIGDFIGANMAYRHFDDSLKLTDWVDDTSVTEIQNVAVQKAPIRDFTAEVDSGSIGAVYPAQIAVNVSAYTDSGTVNYTATDLPTGCQYTADSENKKIILTDLPAGTRTIGIAAEYEGFKLTKYVEVTVNQRDIENDDNIAVKINGNNAPCSIPFSRGFQTVDVKVYDNSTNPPADITESFNISGTRNVFYVGDYSVTVTATDGNYKGSRTVSYAVMAINPEVNRDYTVVVPALPVYDGTPKGVTVTEINGSGVSASKIKYLKSPYIETVSEAPTEAGTYSVFITLKGGNYNSISAATSFTILKADAKIDYTEPFKAAYLYEDEKKIAGKVVNTDSSATSAKAPTGQITVTGTTGVVAPTEVFKKTIDLNPDGSFEFSLPDRSPDTSPLSAGFYNFSVEYSGDNNYNQYSDDEQHYIGISMTRLKLNVSNTEHRYAPGVERKITVSSNSKWLTSDDFTVKYYLVDENSGKLASTVPVSKTIAAGRYLYVISLEGENAKNYGMDFVYEVKDGNTDLPNSRCTNVGFMDIKASSDVSQKPISFAKGVVNLKTGETYTNTLKNENSSTVTYESSDTDVAAVNQNGEVTAKKSGTATITATSTMEGATPVYASYTVNVRKELTQADFEITPEVKKYDGTKTASVKAVLKNKVDENDIVNAQITAEFDSENAGARTVSYEITGISGKDADKYVLADDVNLLKGTVGGTIEKTEITVICAKVTTRTFDGTAQNADISAMANGRIFDSSNYTVKYNGADEAKNPGEYTISIVLNGGLNENYVVLPFEATLKIVKASQDIFAIENVPENVYYGDTFRVTAAAVGNVSYEITEGGDIASIDSTNGIVTINGVGNVTIRAKSELDGYNTRFANKTFKAKQRILTPSAKAAYSDGKRVYDGTNGVDVAIELDNVKIGETVTASASGTMINPDAGNGKLVYVSGITLSDTEHYTLSTNSLQTTVSIEPIEITKCDISASGKKYDGTVSAQATVTEIPEVLSCDKGLVDISGNAEFADKNAGDGKTVTFTASALTGAKAANYTLGNVTAAASADIKPLNVNFTIGQTTFVYDGTDKEVSVTATDENGRIFDGFTVEYAAKPNRAGTYTATIVLDDPTNYVKTQGDITVTVKEATQNQLVITALPGTVEYGDTFKLEANGGADNGTVTWSASGNASISEDGTVTVTGTGRIEIEAVKTSENYNEVSAKVIFTAMPKNVTFELDRLEQIYGMVTEVSVAPSDDRMVSDDYKVTYDGSEEVPVNAGKYKVKAETTNPNYKGSASGTLIIEKAPASGKIVLNKRSYTYGDTVSATAENIPDGATAKITYAGTGIYIPQENAPKNAGNYTAIATITGENYETLTVTKNFTIEKKTLTVKAADASRAYGEANPVFELIYDGFEYGEDKNVLLYEPTATADANASSSVNTYSIKVSGGSAENYKFEYQNTGVLTVTGASGGNLYITGSPSSVYVNDTFALSAFYGNTKVNAVWESSNSEVAEVDGNGTVTAKKAGTVTITATADGNYGNASATFNLTVKQAGITLVPSGLVKTYNGQRQEISFEPIDGFEPILSGEGQNVYVKYTLITDPTVTEPVKAGTYSVTYTVSSGSFTGGGTATMYINKANVKVKPSDAQKEYGDGAPAYKPELVNASDASFADIDEINALARFECDGSANSAEVTENGYEISAVLDRNETENLIVSIEGTGKLTVTKAPLTVTVKDVTREYGAENPPPEVEYTGFKNNETKDVLGGELQFAYADDINSETAVGPYAERIFASGLTSNNYDIHYEKGNVNITKIGVTASAGTARSTYLTIKLDKAVEGLTAANFVIEKGTETIVPSSVTASADNKTYTINGVFAVGAEYTVKTQITNGTHEITNGAVLTIKPASSGGGGGGGGSAPSSYTVKFETNGGSETASAKVTKNETVTEPTAPVKDGYKFGGWFTDKGLTKAYDFSEKVVKSFTLYAKWEKLDTPVEPEWVNPFADVTKDKWYYENVRYAVENGLFGGTSDTTFEPDSDITRGMFITVLYRAEGEPSVDASETFTDIDKNAYYGKAVIWGKQNGIIQGVSDTEFAPDRNITREQMAAMMFRYASYKGAAPTGAWAIRLDYADLDSISEYAAESVMYCKLKGIMQGKDNNNFAPQDNATRAETAAILQRFIEGNK